MLSLDEIRVRLQDRNLSQVGRAIGVSAPYMNLLANGKAKNPSYAVLKKLNGYFEKNK